MGSTESSRTSGLADFAESYAHLALNCKNLVGNKTFYNDTSVVPVTSRVSRKQSPSVTVLIQYAFYP
jgi:hypothetical protein